MRELIVFGRMVGFPEEALTFLQKVNMDGNAFSRLKNPTQLAVRAPAVTRRRGPSARPAPSASWQPFVVAVQTKGYTGRSDTIWTMLNSLRTPAVHDWLTRFSAFCQKSEQSFVLCVPCVGCVTSLVLNPPSADASERQLENAEMLCLIRLGKGLEVAIPTQIASSWLHRLFRLLTCPHLPCSSPCRS